jgi:secondary thiamine-phosphate synthase enzyme
MDSLPKNSHASTGELEIATQRRTQLLDVTAGIAKMVKDSGVHAGVCRVYVPHTTAAITINEGYDPDVAADMESALDRMVPRDARFRHAEGNSDSHIKAALIGNSVSIFVTAGRLELGQWQKIFFCEFDGPRPRQLRLKIVSD